MLNRRGEMGVDVRNTNVRRFRASVFERVLECKMMKVKKYAGNRLCSS
jgi:hypothetical protein